MVGTESEYGTRPKKSAFCRACDDFKTWAKLQKGQKQDSGQEEASTNKDLEGTMRRRSRSSYEEEHRYSAALPQNMPSAAIETDDEVEEVFEEELSDVVSTSSPIHRNCPLDKDELGRSTWGLLHTIAAYYPDNPSQETKDDVRIFFEKFSKMYPCKSCADHFREQITTYPPKVSNQQTLSRWLCDMHNLVNQRTGKPIFDCSRVNERWRDGWKDGSCD